MGNAITKEHVEGRLTIANSDLELRPYEQFGHIPHSQYNGTLAPIFPFLSNGNIDNLGCPSIAFDVNTNTTLPLPPNNWIALVQRGTCPAETKALQAQRLGAIGVIIGNYFPTYDTQEHTSKEYSKEQMQVNIPVYTISGTAYGQSIALIQQMNAREGGLAVEMMPGKHPIDTVYVCSIVIGCLFVFVLLPAACFAISRKLPKESRKKAALAVQAEEKDMPKLGAGDADLPLYEVSRV